MRKQTLSRTPPSVPNGLIRFLQGPGFSLFLGLLLTSSAQAQVRVIDETAIPFAGFLSKSDFDQRFPGETKQSNSELDVGWYVIYEHEALNYCFGPILFESVGEDYLAQLTAIVESAVAQRPEIEGYRLELSYEPSEMESEPSESVETTEPEPSLPLPAPSQPEEKSGLWGFVKKIFGFG